MFRMRRYRLFLLIAALSAASLYYLVSVRHATLSDVGRFRHLTFGQPPSKGQSTDRPDGPPPAEHLPDPPPKLINTPPPDPEDELPASPTTKSKSLPTSAIDDLTGHSEPLDTEKAETVTGEELLPKNPNNEDDPELIASNSSGAEKVLVDGNEPRWVPQKEHNPIAKEKLIKLPPSSKKSPPKIQHEFTAETIQEKTDRLKKLTAIREAFKHAWEGYVQYAMLHDELMPISKSHSDSFMGWGATIIDSLDTLWIMNLKDDFATAIDKLQKIDFKTSYRKEIPMFETVIRLLGGLISAYDLSKEQYPTLLTKAVELADIMMGAFDTPNRMPDTYYKWAPSYASQQHRARTKVVVAELGSLSVEFTRLAQLTGDFKYYDAIARVQDALEEWQMETEIPGLWPLHLDASGCRKADKVKTQSDNDKNGEKPVFLGSEHVSEDNLSRGDTPANLKRHDSSKRETYERRQVDDISASSDLGVGAETKQSDSNIKSLDNTESPDDEFDPYCDKQGLNYEPYAKKHTFGIAAQADSAYEYMPKMHRLLGSSSTQYERMYKNAAKAIREKILYRPMIKENDRKILFPAVYEFDPSNKVKSKRIKTVWEGTHLGCFAGGMFALAAKQFDIPSDMEIAKQLTDGCVWAYESTPTKIMPEKFALTSCTNVDTCLWDEKLWHKALDPNYKERVAAVDAWNKQQEKLYQQTGINVAPGPKDDSMPPNSKSAGNQGDIANVHDSKYGGLQAKREVPDDDTPTKAASHVYEEVAKPVKQLGFVPKIAMSHNTYVKARIQEERLPSGYTKIYDRNYLLRPEAIESVFIMWRLTGENYWRQKGWDMFQAIQTATHTEIGNAGLEDVTSILGEKKDKMESFWLAETLKYFYLLFSEPNVISLDDYVLNTEAHPFRVPRS